MGNNQQLRKLTPSEKDLASDNYHLIRRFLKLSKLNPEEFFDIVVFEFLLAVEIYLSDEELRKNFCFEAVSYMYMRRAVYSHFREQKALKRSPVSGSDISFEETNAYIADSICNMENFSLLEYKEAIKQIESSLTAEQRKIFRDKLKGYSLKEIAENIGIKSERVYRQFRKIRRVVAAVMEVQRIY